MISQFGVCACTGNMKKMSCQPLIQKRVLVCRRSCTMTCHASKKRYSSPLECRYQRKIINKTENGWTEWLPFCKSAEKKWHMEFHKSNAWCGLKYSDQDWKRCSFWKGIAAVSIRNAALLYNESVHSATFFNKNISISWQISTGVSFYTVYSTSLTGTGSWSARTEKKRSGTNLLLTIWAAMLIRSYAKLRIDDLM